MATGGAGRCLGLAVTRPSTARKTFFKNIWILGLFFIKQNKKKPFLKWATQFLTCKASETHPGPDAACRAAKTGITRWEPSTEGR